MVIVILFVTLFLSLWASATRQIGTMIRIEQARSRRINRDKQTLPATRALAQGLAALEIGYPPSPAYTCQVVVDGRPFALTFSRMEGAAWSLTTGESTGGLPTLDLAAFQATPPPPEP